MKLAHIITSIAMAASASGASAFTVGHYNSSKESYGLAGSYIGLAKQSLIDKGYTLTSTGSMDATFLAGVDAVYIPESVFPQVHTFPSSLAAYILSKPAHYLTS